jgi:uncharacterized cupredoxin-like copper-binding protein
MGRSAATLLAVIAVGASLAGCGDEEREEAGTTGTGTAGTEAHAQQPTGPAGATVEMSLVDFELDPSDPEVDQSGVVEFSLSNDGEAPHNLEVETPDGEFELEQDLQPGQTGTLRAQVPEPGEYVMYCPVGDHRERGMEGTLTVTG